MKSIEKKGVPKVRGHFTAQEKIDHCEEVIRLVSEGQTLREYCRVPDSPMFGVIYKWLDQDPEFKERFMRARAVGYDAIAEDCLRIADTPMLGEITTDDKDGQTIKREDMLGHRRLQVDTRLKLLAKFNPKKYGDKVALTGDEENPVKVEVKFDIFEEMLKNLALRRQTEE